MLRFKDYEADYNATYKLLLAGEAHDSQEKHYAPTQDKHRRLYSETIFHACGVQFISVCHLLQSQQTATDT
jgi:hypothetical protein